MKKFYLSILFVLLILFSSGCSGTEVQNSTSSVPPSPDEISKLNEESTPASTNEDTLHEQSETETSEVPPKIPASDTETENIKLPDAIFNENDGIYIMKIGNTEVSKSLFAYYISKAHDSLVGDGKEVIEQKAVFDIKCFEASNILAQKYGVEMSDEYRAQNVTSVIKDTIEMYSAEGSVPYTEALSSFHMTDSVFRLLSENTVLQSFIYDECFSPESGAAHASDEKILEYAHSSCTRVKHIFISTTDLDEEQKAEAKRNAEEILSMHKEGTPFEELIEIYSEDVMMNIDTGYYFTRSSSIVPELKERSFELDIDAVSDIVESAYGYHIIKRYPIDDSQILSNSAPKSDITREICKKAFQDELFAIADSLTPEYYENYSAVLAELFS